MAKKTKPTTRNILVRDLDNDTANKLDKYKESHGIATDSKAVLRMIDRTMPMYGTISDLEAELTKVKMELHLKKSILQQLNISMRQALNMKTDE